MGILEDDRGWLWLSTNDGLSRFDPRTRSFTHYQKSDGLLAAPFNKGAFLKSRDGTLYFGGTNGFTSFDPNRVQGNDFIPPIVLTDFQIFNRPVTIGGPDQRTLIVMDLDLPDLLKRLGVPEVEGGRAVAHDQPLLIMG